MLPESLHLPFVFLVLAAATYALTVRRLAPDAVLFFSVVLVLSAGVISVESAVAKFANIGLFAVGVLYVVAEGLRQTGAVGFTAQRFLGHPKSTAAAQARVMLPCAGLSAFMNNTPVVAAMLPVINDWARKHSVSVSHLLMPLSFVTILGGLCTAIGTSTTVVVDGLIKEYEEANADALNLPAGHMPGLGMFELAAVGLPMTFAGVAFLLVASRRLLPERRPPITDADDAREYTVEMLVEPGSPIDGRTIEEAGLRALPSMYLLEVDRGGAVLPAVRPSEVLKGGDRLVFVGVVDSVVDLRKIPGLLPATNQIFKLNAPNHVRRLVEAVVSNTYPYLRTTIRESRFRTRYNAAVIAVARNGERISGKVGDIELLPGDTLLLEAPPEFLAAQRNSRDFFLVSNVDDSTPPRHDRVWLARAILVLTVVLIAGGLFDIFLGASLGAGLMILTGCCRVSEARRAIDWSVLIAMGSGLALGEALDQTGGAALVADAAIGLVAGNAHATLAVVLLLTMACANLMTAKAAATLFFPIAMNAAAALDGANHMPFAVAVIVASAGTFATPVGYQTNLMVFGPGGYRPSDYLRVGGPLSLVVAAVAVITIPLAWPF